MKEEKVLQPHYQSTEGEVWVRGLTEGRICSELTVGDMLGK